MQNEDDYVKRRFKKAVARSMTMLEVDGASDDCKRQIKANFWDLHRDIENGEGQDYHNRNY